MNPMPRGFNGPPRGFNGRGGGMMRFPSRGMGFRYVSLKLLFFYWFSHEFDSRPFCIHLKKLRLLSEVDHHAEAADHTKTISRDKGNFPIHLSSLGIDSSEFLSLTTFSY